MKADHTGKRSDFILRQSLYGVLSLENISIRLRPIGNLYRLFFYKKMVRREIELAGMGTDAKIAQIGSGPYPMTALELADKGFRIDCYDIDPRAIKDSTAYICRHGLKSCINIYDCSKQQCVYNKYDVIFLSLHIIGKERVIDRILETVGDGTTIIYRNPAGLLKGFYKAYYPTLTHKNELKVIRQPFFKESVAVRM